jgi:hypothetical protein
MTRLQSSAVQFLYLWAKLNLARTCLLARRGFLLHTSTQPTSLKARLKVMSNVYKFFLKVVLQLHLPFWDNQQWQGAHQFASLAILKPLDVLLFAFLTLISLLIWATVDWLIPSESATFFVESPLLSCTNALCFNDSHNRGIEIQLTNELSL